MLKPELLAFTPALTSINVARSFFSELAQHFHYGRPGTKASRQGSHSFGGKAQ